MEEDNKIIAKFCFDLENDSGAWIKDDGEEFTIPKEWSGIGKHHERWFQLEGEDNKAHWVNYRQVFSRKNNQVIIKVWYKKEVNGIRKDYSLTIPKENNLTEVTITEQDEVVKRFNPIKNEETWQRLYDYD